MTTNATFSFYVKPAVAFFREHELENFRNFLGALERHTTIFPIDREREVQLHPDGSTLTGSYRFTPGAFTQLCQLMASGAFRFLTDIAGMSPRSRDPEVLKNCDEAVRVFNNVVHLRFPVIQQMRLIRNECTKTIDGIIGVQHKYLDNSMLYSLVDTAIGDAQLPVRFYAATIIGRRAAIWYRNPQPFCELQVGAAKWACHHGYYCGNGEAAGVSVRITPAIFLPPGIVLGSFRRIGGRVTHAGRNFQQRLAKTLSRVLGEPPAVQQWFQALQRLQQTSLEFAGKSAKERRQHERHIINGLDRCGVARNIGADVLQDAVYRGAVPPSREVVDLAPLADIRTLFDVLVALLRVSRRLGLSRRERLEQAAYDVLTGRFHY